MVVEFKPATSDHLSSFIPHIAVPNFVESLNGGWAGWVGGWAELGWAGLSRWAAWQAAGHQGRLAGSFAAAFHPRKSRQQRQQQAAAAVTCFALTLLAASPPALPLRYASLQTPQT
jgi:hypothetical protein